MAKFRALEIQGFRSFCGKQEVVFDGDLAVLWGPNSQGKTSTCEAFEFLLTGTTVRRELTAGSQDEFAGALRNVHLPDSREVYVQATVDADDGSRHVVRRVLLTDFEKKAPCGSQLEIDGSVAGEAGLRELGFSLSQPPMQAPILLQHTLGYLFSARPGDRSSYFKAILEVADLDDVRRDMQDAIKSIPSPSYSRQPALERLKTVPTVVSLLKVHLKGTPGPDAIQTAFALAAGALLKDAAVALRAPADSSIDGLRRHLESRQEAAFPVDLLRFTSMPPSAFKGADTGDVEGLRAADSAVEREVERFGGLYRELLRVHPFAATEHPVDCPACGTVGGLTPDRLLALTARLRESHDYHEALTRARDWLSQSRRSLEADARAFRSMRLVPVRRERLRKGFGTRQMMALIGDSKRDLVLEWIKSVRRVSRSRAAILRSGGRLVATLPAEASLAGTDLALFRAESGDYLARREELYAAIDEGKRNIAALREAISFAISAQTSTVGWQDVLDLHGDSVALSEHLRNLRAFEALGKEHDRAMKEFDAAREALVSGKFAELSDEIKRWWELLRPESFAAFESVGMRAKTVRTVDFKVALRPDDTKSSGEIRDAIAVFSGSQLHCLGVAAFLARSFRGGGGFVVLDDPVLSSDHEHRAGFVNRVIEELVNAGVQVILLTQEQRCRDDIGVRYEHLKPDLFRIEMNAPLEGTVVTKTSDGVADKLARIKTLLSGTDEATRKQAAGELRDTAERLCKEVLVKHHGPPKALVDFDGQVLGGLIDLIDKERLFKAPDHKGKLMLLKRWTNPGNHDAPVPSSLELKSVFGDLKKFAKDYLN